MEPTRSAYFLLKKHLLYLDAPRMAKSSSLYGGSHSSGGASVASQLDAGPAGKDSSPRRIFGGAGQSNEALAFIQQHISSIHRFDASAKGGIGAHGNATTKRQAANAAAAAAAASAPAAQKSQLGVELEIAVYCLQKSAERLPTPQLSLLELIRAVVLHMSFHKSPTGVVGGDYILKALTMFFGIDKAEAFGRYAVALLECSCLRPATGRGTLVIPATAGLIQSVGEFERSFFLVQTPSQTAELSRVVEFRESATRLMCLFCARAVQDGANELIYLSHSRWLFGPPPEPITPGSPGARLASEEDLDLDSPFSPFPDRFRRGLLGPLFQYVAGFCAAECKMLEALHDQCAIVRLDGVKFALAQLCPSNAPPLVKDVDSGKMARCDTSVSLLLGFPEQVPDNVIHIGVKKLLDAVELANGPRRLLGSGMASAEFRVMLRELGAKMFSLVTELFFRPDAPNVCHVRRQRHRGWASAGGQTPVQGGGGGSGADSQSTQELCGLVDNGIDDQVPIAQRSKRPYNGFPSFVPFALNHRASTHALSRRSCSVATQILLSLRDASQAFGGCVCVAMFYHGRLIVSDCHPFVTALLGLRARLSFYDSAPPRTVSIADESAAAFTAAPAAATPHTSSSTALGSFGPKTGEMWTSVPLRDQMPHGIFADGTFGEPSVRPVSRSASPGPVPRSPRSGATPPAGSNDGSECAPTSPNSPTPDDEEVLKALATLRPHLFNIWCYFSEEIASLLPVPELCPKAATGAVAGSPPTTSSPPPQPAASSSFTSAAAAAAQESGPGIRKTSAYGCAVERGGDGKTMDAGFYHGVHLTANGIDIVLVLPLRYHSEGSQAYESLKTADAIAETFMSELSAVAREVHSLSSHMARSDSVPREIEPVSAAHNSGGGAEDSMGPHVDPNTLLPSGAGANATAVGGVSAITSVSKEVATTAPLCVVHDLALGVAEFLEGPLGSQEESVQQRVVPTALLLNRATVFLSECNVLAELLGTSLRLPPRHPDDSDASASAVPFAAEPNTRVILGRSAFHEKDRKGPHVVLYARHSGGQQAFYGVPSGCATPATLRTVEDNYVQFASSSRSHTVVI